jgi:CheY-like chemotaxis protein
MNLATNARDAMPEGGKLSIATELVTLDHRFSKSRGLSAPGSYAKVTVADTGVGIDQDTMKRIFDPFFTTKSVGKGTGLGLAIVYGIIEKHGGAISCYSEPGMGAIFTIFIPAVQAKVEEAAPEADVHISGGTETILMAEDDGVVREFARDLLEEYGYTFIEAVDGEDVVQKFREHQDTVQLLILDIIMPRKNGMEAYEEIRKLKPAVKVIFSSGYEAAAILNKGKLKADMHYLAKPVTPANLLTKIREVLDS